MSTEELSTQQDNIKDRKKGKALGIRERCVRVNCGFITLFSSETR